MLSPIILHEIALEWNVPFLIPLRGVGSDILVMIKLAQWNWFFK
jgi:hypothetical protein